MRMESAPIRAFRVDLIRICCTSPQHRKHPPITTKWPPDYFLLLGEPIHTSIPEGRTSSIFVECFLAFFLPAGWAIGGVQRPGDVLGWWQGVPIEGAHNATILTQSTGQPHALSLRRPARTLQEQIVRSQRGHFSLPQCGHGFCCDRHSVSSTRSRARLMPGAFSPGRKCWPRFSASGMNS